MGTLYEERLINFDRQRGRWQWDIEQIRQTDITDNIVELMTGKIRRLPEKTQAGLQLAACIGNQFDLKTLAIVAETAETETEQDLQPALQEGLLLGSGQNGSSSYQFPHDRIQQAAYSLIADDHKEEVHLKIGRLLLKNTPKEERAEKIFDIVNPLNIGQTLLSHRPEQDELAELNLLAGRKAKAAAAYGPALNYLRVGMGLLPEDGWQTRYETTLALHVEAAEAAYLDGNFGEMERLAEVVLEHAETLLDKVKVYQVKLEACTVQNKMLEALQTARPVLKLLGVTLPQKPNTLHILLGLLQTKFTLTGKRIESLIDLPPMTDPYHLATMRILSRVYSAVYIAAPELLPLVTFKMVNLSVKYGNTTEAGSAMGYASYGLILCAAVGEIDSGHRFGQLALNLLERFNTKKGKSGPVFMVNFFVRHWKEHARETLPSLLEAYQSGLETGDLDFAAYSPIVYCLYSLYTGQELAGLDREMVLYRDVVGQLKHDTAHQYMRLYRQLALNLLEQTENPGRLQSDNYDEAVMLPLHIQANDRYAIFCVHFFKQILCYLFQI